MTLPESNVGPPPGPVAKPTRPRFALDPRFHAPLLITCILLSAHHTMGILESPRQTLIAIFTAIAVEVALGRLANGLFPHLASAYITGISVGVLVRTPLDWPFALCSAISIMSKYVIRLEGRHIWNPSNFGVSFLIFMYPGYVSHLSVQWGNAWWSLALVWGLGFVVISRLKRFHICLTYVVSFLTLALIRSAITGHPLLAEVAPITGPMYQLFILYMITDPRTTVKSRGGQMVTVMVIAFVESVLRTLPTFLPTSPFVLGAAIHAPFYALFMVGPCFFTREVLADARSARAAAAN